MGPSLAGNVWGPGASADKAFSGPIRLLPKGEHVLNWFPAPATSSTAPVPKEQEAAQHILGSRVRRDLVEKPESAAFLSKLTLGLSLVSQGELHVRKCSCQKLVFCLF